MTRELLWARIDSANKEMGREIVAASFIRDDDGMVMCSKSPFVSFWMNSQGKFYGEPTHWLGYLPLHFPAATCMAKDE